MPEIVVIEEDVVVAGDLRPCAYCGTPIHLASHRCEHCGGHVGLAWGTVHKEIFLFLFLAVLIGVGCLVSWNGRSPVLVADTPPLVSPPAPGRPAPPPEPVKWVVTQDVTVSGSPLDGTDTLRGSLLLAIAAYGVIVGIFNALFRRLVMWPFVVNGFLALWVGLSGVISAMSSPTWGYWKDWAQGKSVLEKFAAPLRTIPPGMLLLALAGVLTVFKLVTGIVAGASKGKAEASDAAETVRTSAAARRRARLEKTGAEDPGSVASDAGPISPEPPPPSDSTRPYPPPLA
jgi:hypothetical protein